MNALPQPTASDDIPVEDESQPQIDFLSTAFAIVGTGSFLYFVNVIVALHQFREKDFSYLGMSLPGKAFNSEVAIFALTFMWIPLVVLHLIAHFYQSYCRRAKKTPPHFPNSIAKLAIPTAWSWVRNSLFIALLVLPTAGYVFIAGRTFAHYGIVDRNLIPDAFETDGKTSTASLLLIPANDSAVRGWNLLTDYPATTSGQRYDWDSSGWAWINTHRSDELRPRLSDPPKTTRIVTIGAIPIIQPWGFVVMSALGIISAGALLIRGLRAR